MTFKSWQWNEIHPCGIFLATSGSNDVRILFWHELEIASEDSHLNDLKKSSVFQDSFQFNNENPKNACFESSTSNFVTSHIQDNDLFFDSHLNSVKNLLSPMMLTDHKLINLKINNLVYVGMTFSLVPDEIESLTLKSIKKKKGSSPQRNKRPSFTLYDSISDLSDEEQSTDNENFQNYDNSKTMTTFSVIFVLSSLTPPCLQHYYAELAKVIGIQLRRAEVFWGYLSIQQDLIVKQIEAITGTNDELDGGQLESSRAHNSCRRMCDSNEVFDQILEKISSKKSDKNDDARIALKKKIKEVLLKESVLYREIVQIFDDACNWGIVNSKIKGFYPVYFTIPHKAYCFIVDKNRYSINKTLMNKLINSPLIGLEPRKIFNAIDHLKTYHTLIFLHPKEVMIKKFLPCNISRIMIEFIMHLKSTMSLMEASVKFFSIEKILEMAKFLILRGLAVIAYPICKSNVYILNPQDSRFNILQPLNIIDFSGEFPDLNLASVLSSFSVPISINDHIETAKLIEPMSNSLSFGYSQCKIDENNVEVEFGKSSANFWANITMSRIVNLINWLLSKRLIIQIHQTIFPIKNIQERAARNLSIFSSDSPKSPSSYGLSRRRSAPIINCLASKSFDEQLKQIPDEIRTFMTSLFPSSVAQSILLNKFCPQYFKTKISDEIQKMPDDNLSQISRNQMSGMNWNSLMDFLTVYSKLPCHIDKLVYEMGKTYEEISCTLQNYSIFVRLCPIPDDLVSIFSGISIDKYN